MARARAKARHILVADEAKCNELIDSIKGGRDFASVAQDYSQCPSSANGGDLGEFGPGEMVPAFDKVVFSADVGEVVGPVKTDFGYHIIEVTSRS